jgi:hypothetical protein
MYPIENPQKISNAQQIFERPGFAKARNAVVIKIRPDQRNLGFLMKSFTATWPQLDEQKEVHLVVLSVGWEDKAERDRCANGLTSSVPVERRDLYAGRFKGSEPFGGLWRFVVDGFVPLGIKDPAVKHTEFYGTPPAGSRWYLPPMSD